MANPVFKEAGEQALKDLRPICEAYLNSVDELERFLRAIFALEQQEQIMADRFANELVSPMKSIRKSAKKIHGALQKDKES